MNEEQKNLRHSQRHEHQLTPMSIDKLRQLMSAQDKLLLNRNDIYSPYENIRSSWGADGGWGE